MSSENKSSPSRRPRKPKEEKDWSGVIRIILIWAVILALIPGISYLNRIYEGDITTFDYYTDFLAAVQEDRIKTVNISDDATGNELATGKYVTKEGKPAWIFLGRRQSLRD